MMVAGKAVYLNFQTSLYQFTPLQSTLIVLNNPCSHATNQPIGTNADKLALLILNL